MQELVESITTNGVLTPVLVRPLGMDTYEMISGHRRMHAAKLAGLEKIPTIIREMTDDEAVICMVDANVQREELLPSEKAFAYKMKMEAKKQMLRSLICKLLSSRSTKPKGGILWNRKQHSGISMAKKLICIAFTGYQNYYLQMTISKP